MKRATKQFGTFVTNSDQNSDQMQQRAIRRRRAITAASTAALMGLGAFALPARAATVTWTGAIADPNSSLYTSTLLTAAPFPAPFYVNGQNVYQWNTTVANWSGAPTYTAGDNAVFTDNPANNSGATTFINVTAANMNPTNLTFSSAAGGSTATRYVFLRSGDVVNGATSITSNTPFGAANPSSTLTLDTGFLGTVTIRSRINSGALNGNTIVRSGTLEVQETQAIPGGATSQTPTITLAGGTLAFNVQTAGNTAPGSADYNGAMTVTADSTMAITRDSNGGAITNARTWQGPITVNSGVALNLTSSNADGNSLVFNLTGNLNSSTGTFRLVDSNPAVPTVVSMQSTTGGAGSTTAIFDLGVGSSALQTNFAVATTASLGALTGGANTVLRGSNSSNIGITDTYSIGAKGTNTTFAGQIQQGTGLVPHTTAITKVGAGSLTLTNAGNSYAGQTTVSAGSLILSGAGAATASVGSTLTVGGTLRLDNSTTSVNDRFGDAAKITGSGGTLEFVGNRGSATAEQVGTLAVTTGDTNVTASAVGASGTASLTFSDLTRSSGATVNFNLATGVDLKFTTAPTPINGIIGGFATVNNTDFAALSGNTVVAYTGYTPAGNGANADTWVAANNVDVTATSPLAATTTNVAINSLRLTGAGTVTVGAGQTLSIGTGTSAGPGGILAPGTANQSIGGAGSLTAGNAGTVADLITLIPNAANTLTIATPIVNNAGGTVTLVKSGAGTLVLTSGSNTFTGGTKILGGSIVAGGDNTLSGDLTIDNGTNFNLAGYNQTVGNVTLINGTATNSASPGPHGAGATLSGNAFNVRLGTVSLNLTGTGALTKTTAGLVTLTGANNYSGGTTVSAGTLVAGATNTLPNALTVVSGGTLDIGTFNQTVGNLQLGTSTGVILGSGTLTATNYDVSAGSAAPVLAGAASVTKTTASAVTFTGANTYTGPTTITLGTLQVSSIADAGTPSALGNPATSGATGLVLNGGILTYVGAGNSSNRLFTLSAASTLTANGTGPLNLTNTGAMGGGGVVLTINGTNTGNNTLSTQIGGSTGVSKGGAGTWVLANANSNYTGVTTVSQGILVVNSLANSGSPSPIGAGDATAATTVLSGGTLQYLGAAGSTNRLFTLGGNSTIDSSGSGPINFTNAGNMGNGTGFTLTLTGSNTGANTISAAIGALGTTAAINKTGTGNWILNGSLTYTGTTTAATTVAAGKLTLATNQVKNLAVSVTGGTLELAAGGGSNRVLRTGPLTTSLAITGSGKIDLQDNKLITGRPVGTWTGTAYTDVTGFIKTGRNGGGWGGSTGIVTSQTQAIAGNFTTLGVATAAQVKGIPASSSAVWAGQTVTGSDTLVMYTYGGDANLDGKINVDDYTRIDFNVPLGTNGWYNGDFNYDGKINVDDYTIIDFNVGIQGAAFPTGSGVGSGGAGGLSGVSAVPEPASLSIIGLAAASLMGRRRRRK